MNGKIKTNPMNFSFMDTFFIIYSFGEKRTSINYSYWTKIILQIKTYFTNSNYTRVYMLKRDDNLKAIN